MQPLSLTGVHLVRSKRIVPLTIELINLYFSFLRSTVPTCTPCLETSIKLKLKEAGWKKKISNHCFSPSNRSVKRSSEISPYNSENKESNSENKTGKNKTFVLLFRRKSASNSFWKTGWKIPMANCRSARFNNIRAKYRPYWKNTRGNRSIS